MLGIRICAIAEALLLIITVAMKFDTSTGIICFCVVYICKNIMEIMRDKE